MRCKMHSYDHKRLIKKVISRAVSRCLDSDSIWDLHKQMYVFLKSDKLSQSPNQDSITRKLNVIYVKHGANEKQLMENCPCYRCVQSILYNSIKSKVFK